MAGPVAVVVAEVAGRAPGPDPDGIRLGRLVDGLVAALARRSSDPGG